MEGYINKDTIVENDLSKIFISFSMCPLCNNILIKPVMCMKCQKNYCKKCIDNWSENNKKCPEGCNAPNYQNSIGKNDILSQLKFRCIGCSKEILYDEAQRHHEICCPDKNSSEPKKEEKEEKEDKFENIVEEYENIEENVNSKNSKLKKLSPEESALLVKKGKIMKYITSK